MLELRNLGEQTGHDVLGELVFLLLFVQPCEVFIFKLHVVKLLVEAIERLGVALFVNETLTFLQSLGELFFLGPKQLDPVDLFGLSKLGSFFFALELFFFLALSFFHLRFTILDLGLQSIELSLTFFFHNTTKSIKSLFIFIAEFGNQFLGVHLMRLISLLHLVNAITSSLFLKKLSLEVSQLVKLFLLLRQVKLKFLLLFIELVELFSVLPLELFAKFLHSFTVFSLAFHVHVGD